MQKHNAAIAYGADRRQFGRRSTLWHAWIVTGSRQRIPCCIRNVSAGGALLECEVPSWLPPKFDLVVEEHGLSIRCDLRHRGESGIGVSFSEPGKGELLTELRGPSGQPASAQKHATPAAPASGEPQPAAIARPRLSAELIAKALQRRS